MATYYISEFGSDSNNGLGPDPTHGTNKPWLTLGKALASGSPVVAGDTVYIGPGRISSVAGIVVLGTISSSASPTSFIGDPTNAQGFKNGSGVLLSPDYVILSMRTSAQDDDTAATSGTVMLDLATNAPDGLTFRNLVWDGRPNNGIFATVTLAGGEDWLFEQCVFNNNTLLNLTAGGAATAGRNWTFRRCTIFGSNCFTTSVTVAAATADADLNIQFERCIILGNVMSALALSASGGNLAGGIDINECTLFGGTYSTTALRVSTTTPNRIRGNLFLGYFLVQAGTSGQIVDDGYNRWVGAFQTSMTSVTAAGTTKFGVLPRIVFPNYTQWGLGLPRDDWFGWIDSAISGVKFSASGATTADFRGRTPAPWGAGASIGAWQVPAVAQDATSAITGGGTNSLKLTGKGEVSVWVPVDAESTTLSITTKSTSYGGTNWPQMIVVANPSIGVTQQTATASSATEAAISTSAFTPTAKGVVEVRLISRSSSTTSETWFDSLSKA